MTTISPEDGVVTLINVFTVEPEQQQKVVDLLIRATENIMKHLPGFVSANIHKSFDGTRVVNYAAQWKSREDFEAMLRNPEAIPHRKEVASLVQKFDPHLYEVVESIHI